MKQPISIIAGSSNNELAHAAAKHLKIKLVPSEMQYFSNSELRPVIGESVRNKDVFIIQTGGFSRQYGVAPGDMRSVNDYLVETYLLMRTLKRSDVRTMTLVMPFFPYSRQDKKDNPRGAISARDVADMFEFAGLHRIVTFDLHSPQIQGFFNVPCDNLYTAHLIKDYFDKKIFKKDYQNNYALIAPDEGALKRMREYAGMFNLPLFVLSKERDYRKKNEVEKTILIGNPEDIKGRTAIIIDDMIDTFGTIDTASKLIQEAGAKGLIVAATHGIFSGPAIERINKNSFIEHILVSDSIPQAANQAQSKKIDTYSIAPMVAETIRRLSRGESLSTMFSK
jgi:ribose-phosphate pyrophosphokinase